MTCPFALFHAGDAYSTAAKIMGRQSAGRALIRGLARTWPQADLAAIGHGAAAARALLAQLRGDGFAGTLDWSDVPELRPARRVGALYYPAPPAAALAAARNLVDPAAFSLIGVTHTLASTAAMDQLGDLILPPFAPWDALICTSQAAHRLVVALQDELRAHWRATIGATRFVEIQLPVIPLGIDAPSFAPVPAARAAARAALDMVPEEVVFLFAGRLSFHAKANPAPLYQALQRAAATLPTRRLVAVEAGIFPNAAIGAAYRAAQQALAPAIRFVQVDGQDRARYRQAWQAADAFVSLADNIQETFGLAPVEAMAAGLPVIVADWDGYRDTVRAGVDGFRIPTILPPAGAGAELALRHALGADNYDFHVGRASLATVVAPDALADAIARLAEDAGLRRSLGAAGQARASAEFDWPVILRRYAELAAELAALRARHAPRPPQPWPQRADPFRRFAHFASATLAGSWTLRPLPGLSDRAAAIAGLAVANYAFDPDPGLRGAIDALVASLERDGARSVQTVLSDAGLATPTGARAVMWLWKFGLVDIRTG